jgi:nucleotidyltransferase substrate binding protein (TIGR01987 family)
MTTQNLIQQVKAVILTHAKPNRIYLYGSQASGEADASSDIDIAFDDPELASDQLAAITTAVNNLDTLKKIEVKNLAYTSERFRNRVKSTGKVLYSRTKQQRAEDQLHNFQNALQKLSDAIDRKAEFLQEGFGDIYLDVIVKRFEFTYEMAWKAIKRYLDYQGITCKSPRSCFKEAYAQGMLDEEQVWLEMIEYRNLAAHIYEQEEIEQLLDHIDRFDKAFQQLRAYLESQLNHSR